MAAARLARQAADAWTPAHAEQAPLRGRLDRPDQPDAVDLARTSTTRRSARSRFDQLREAYAEQMRGPASRAACDLLLIETIFDTLNAKAALVGGRGGVRRSRAARAGDALGHDHRPQRPHAVGPDGRGLLDLGRARAAVGRRASTAPSAPATCGRTSRSWRALPARSSAATRTRGCPTRSAGYDETPARHGGGPRASSPLAGLVNLVGGCCGTTPAHVAAIAARRGGRCAPRPLPESLPRLTRYAGLEPLTLRPDSNFQMIGERTNVTGSPRFRRLIKAERLRAGRRRRPRAGARRRQHHRREHGRGHARLRAGDDPLPQPDRHRARDRPPPGHDRQLALVGPRGRAEVRPGQADRQLDQPQGRRGGVPPPRADRPAATARRSW